jgi:hypothetical protein
MHDAAVHDREDGSEKAELIILHSVLQPWHRQPRDLGGAQ